jgi:predicted O-methyltransferase YrrM
MEFIDDKILTYCENHTTPESEVLADLNRTTYAKVLAPRMLSGHLQGSFLAMLSRMIKPTNILEIGTYTGYSGICLCEGLKEGGKLTTIDINDELTDLVKSFFDRANLIDKVNIIAGDAMEIIPSLNDRFDLVFIDADKKNYSNYFDLVIDKVNIGGYIVADNVLWSGNVVKNENEWDHETKHLVEFNDKINADDRIQKVLLPIRDGLYLIEKIK